jgi:hypothetical protein
MAMRPGRIGIAGVLASLLAFSGVAHASATIDLLWDGTTDTLCGVPASSQITLHVVLTAGPSGSMGGGISVDYSDSIGKAELVDFSSSPPDSVFGLNLGQTTDSGSMVRNINGACFPPLEIGECLGAGESYLLGTLTFHKTVGAGGFEIIPLVDRTGSDDVLDLGGNVITGTTTFNSAYVIKAGVGKGASLNDRAGKPRRCRKLK